MSLAEVITFMQTVLMVIGALTLIGGLGAGFLLLSLRRAPDTHFPLDDMPSGWSVLDSATPEHFKHMERDA